MPDQNGNPLPGERGHWRFKKDQKITRGQTTTESLFKVPKLSKEAKEKLDDVVEDLADDGKRNYSHDPKRKSPGRKKKRAIKKKKR